VSTQPTSTYLTPEQYLEIERRAEFKSEYHAGEMFAMSGAKEGHNLVAGNTFGELRQQLRPKGCRVYTNDLRVRIKSADLYVYPDVVAVCGEPRFLDDQRDTLLNPSLIVEVLSPSTEAYDRGRKFEYYKTLESLREYMLLAQDRIHADLYVRQPDGRWLLTSADRLEDSLALESVGATLRLADLYAQVELQSHP
jgi:Uma2 family endonuclease